MAVENPSQQESSIDSENIFDEFTNSQDIKDEIAKTENLKQKDMYYYLKKLNSVFFIANMLLFIFIILGALYIYVQEKETKKEYSFLSPICNLFL